MTLIEKKSYLVIIQLNNNAQQMIPRNEVGGLNIIT